MYLVKTVKFSCIFNMVLIVSIFGFFLLLFTYADNLNNTIHRPVIFTLDNRASPDFNDHNQFSIVNYTWNCVNNKCERSVFSNNDEERMCLETCNMICGDTPMLWPKPQRINFKSKTYTTITKNQIFINFTQTSPITKRLQNVTERFLRKFENFPNIDGATTTMTKRVFIRISVREENSTRLQLTTNEDYSLRITKNDDIFVEIQAATYFGVRHCLETLSQLIWFDKVTKRLNLFDNIEIDDFPKFPYRSLMVDTARNYFTIKQLLRIIDGMALNKLNVLHLHLTDVESFPIILPTIKHLTNYGAYQSDMVYTVDNIHDLIDYGLMNGVRVILEVDAPAHVNAGWQFAEDQYNETFVICGQDNVFNGHLNPDNKNVLAVLQLIYKDLLNLQNNDEIFHIGGDEVNLDCWRTTETAKNYTDLYKFWTDYLNSMLEHLKLANHNRELPKTVVLWSSPLTDSNYLKSLIGNITVQYWFGNPTNILNNGNSIIWSTVGQWYLDCGYGPWRPNMGDHGNCDPYTPWQKVYKYQPWRLYGHEHQTMGGEICLWTEQVDVDDLETRIWPRSAAFAERLWTDPQQFNDYDVYTRFQTQRERLVLNNIKTAGISPRWCTQNPGKCGF